MSQERRRQRRTLAVTPAGLRTGRPEDAGEHLAVIRDASATGAMLLARGNFAVGEELTLGILFVVDQPVVDVTARVVRVETVTEGIWNAKLGVEFTPARPDLVPAFEKLVRG
ncbi:MAG: PilZ domain-containing protein [Myxococcota bacterium]